MRMKALRVNAGSYLVWVVLLLGACASAPQQKLNAELKQSVKTIALLPIIDPETYIAANIGSMKGFLLGPFGGFLEGKENEASTKKFTTEVNRLKLDIGNELLKAIKQGLINKGYKVTLLEKRPPEKANGESDYSNINTDADAILDVWFRAAGYISPPNSIGYEPWLMVSSRMVSSESRAQIYFQAFNYAADLGKIDNIIYFEQIGSKEFSSVDAIIKDINVAVAELRKGLPLVTNGVLNEL